MRRIFFTKSEFLALCGLGLGTHLFVKVPRLGDSEETFLVFESRLFGL